MENKKMTRKDWLIAIRAYINESEWDEADGAIEAIDKMIASLEKKASVPTKTQKENEGVMTTIVEALAYIGKPSTCSELMKHPSLAMYSNQKLSALLKKLVDKGEVVKTVEKKVSYFSLA